MSHPVWDEWIEIQKDGRRYGRVNGLIPFGMSGLKYTQCPDRVPQLGSLIPFGMSGLKYIRGHQIYEDEKCLIPFGMSGLK